MIHKNLFCFIIMSVVLNHYHEVKSGSSDLPDFVKLLAHH